MLSTSLRNALVTLPLLASVHGSAQELRTRSIPHSQDEMHARVVALYSFHPSTLPHDEIQKKSAQMDIFWNEMKAAPDTTLPLLRAELRNRDDPSFFFMDGASLLLDLSKSKADEELAVSVLPRVDLIDAQPTAYFYFVHRAECDGVDATAAALHTLDDEHFTVSVPQHAMTLDQRMSLMYLLLTMDETLWVKSAGERLRTETDDKKKIALVDALYYAQTDEADQILTAVAAAPATSAAVRQEVQRLQKTSFDLSRSHQPMKGTIEQIRKQRRERLKAISDEAVDDVQWMTRKIAQLRAKEARKTS